MHFPRELVRKLGTGEALWEKVKILRNNMYVRAPMLNTQKGHPDGTISAYMEVCDYLNFPTTSEGGWIQGGNTPEIKKIFFYIVFIYVTQANK